MLSHDVASTSFALTSVLMKIFRSRSNDVINECRTMFGLLSIEQQVQKIKVKFLPKSIDSENSACTLFVRDTTSELTSLCN